MAKQTKKGPLSYVDQVSRSTFKVTAAMRERESALLRQIAKLERAGIVDATENYRDGKYLYLYHPQKNGIRRKEYVGCEPHRVQRALDSIERYQEHKRLSVELRKLREAADSLCETSDQLAESMESAKRVIRRSSENRSRVSG